MCDPPSLGVRPRDRDDLGLSDLSIQLRVTQILPSTFVGQARPTPVGEPWKPVLSVANSQKVRGWKPRSWAAKRPSHVATPASQAPQEARPLSGNGSISWILLQDGVLRTERRR